MEKDRAIKEIQAGIEEVGERMAAGISELQAEREAVERRVAADTTEKQKDSDRFAEEFWEGE